MGDESAGGGAHLNAACGGGFGLKRSFRRRDDQFILGKNVRKPAVFREMHIWRVKHALWQPSFMRQVLQTFFALTFGHRHFSCR